MFVNFSGLGNAIAVAGLFRAIERSGAGWTCFHNSAPALDDRNFRDLAGLGNFGGLYPSPWRRFAPVDHAAILRYIEQNAIDTIINLRNEGPLRDVGYARFKADMQKALDFFDLDDRHAGGVIASRNLFEQHYDLVRAAGAPVALDYAWLRPSVNVPLRPRLVALFTTSSQSVKRWPRECWLELIQHIHRRYHPPFVVIAGDADLERHDARTLATAIRERCPDIELGVVENREVVRTVRTIAETEVLIANDTSTVHIAAALGIPTIGLYFSTSAAVWGGLSPHFSAVQSRSGQQCPEQKPGTGNCLRYYGTCDAPCKVEITPERVLRVIRDSVGEKLEPAYAAAL